MTLTADTPSDSLSILGGDGVITSETASPDKVIIDLDYTSTAAGLLIDGSQKVGAKVDNSTIIVNASGELESQGASLALDDLLDVVITTPANDDILVFDGVNWVNKDMNLSGTIGAETTETVTVVTSVTGVPGSAASATHTHSTNSTSTASATHRHWLSFANAWSGYASAGFTAYQSLGAGSGSTPVKTSASDQSETVTSRTHSHTLNTLAITYA